VDANFCKKCGTRLAASTEVPSETAQRANPLDRSILGEMAIRLTAPESDGIDGERKTVTALFADLKGSTELLETLDPEEGRAIVDPLLRIMSDAVRRYEGYLVRTTGDGVFASQSTALHIWSVRVKFAFATAAELRRDAFPNTVLYRSDNSPIEPSYVRIGEQKDIELGSFW
jgi:class 3 adenylate cyclase